MVLAAGLGAGLCAAPSPARALSCETHNGEQLDVELVSAERDGTPLELDALAGVGARWISEISRSWDERVVVRDEDHNKFVGLELDMAIDPSAEVTDYIADAEARRDGGGLLCGGLDYVPVYPGVYMLDAGDEDLEWPEGGTLTIDAARETVVVEYSNVVGDYVLTYEVVDFYFPGDDEGGCSVADAGDATTPLGALGGLGLLGLGAWRARRRRRCAD